MKVVASMATMKEREDALKDTVESLLANPFDVINVFGHGYSEMPDFCKDPRINFQPGEGLPDNGDADKFYWAGALDDDTVHFTCDDDLIYPENYAFVMRSKLQKHNYGIVVTVLGHLLQNFPIRNYFGGDYRRCYNCLKQVDGDHWCMYGGTGVMAYYTGTVKPTIEAFPRPNMADIWMGLHCQSSKIPVLSVGHPDGWLRYTNKVPLEATIAGKTMAVEKNQLQCEVINTFNEQDGWKVYEPQG